MKVYKFSMFLIFVTALALLYVHQQVQLLQLSYKIELNEKEAATLLDQNRSLVYNITRLKSPVYLQEKFLASKKDFRVPQGWQVVEAVTPELNKKQTVVLAKTASEQNKGFGIFNVFLRPKEALAKTIK